jgi:hypothetical protein
MIGDSGEVDQRLGTRPANGSGSEIRAAQAFQRKAEFYLDLSRQDTHLASVSWEALRIFGESFNSGEG